MIHLANILDIAMQNLPDGIVELWKHLDGLLGVGCGGLRPPMKKQP